VKESECIMAQIFCKIIIASDLLRQLRADNIDGIIDVVKLEDMIKTLTRWEGLLYKKMDIDYEG